MATSRLRKTFKYPADSDDEDAVEEGMDEQDRTQILTTLSTTDTSQTSLYTLLLLPLPLLPLLLHTPLLLSSPPTFLSALAAITSLALSAYTLYFLPLPPARYTSGGSVFGAQDEAGAADNGKKGAGAGGGPGMRTLTLSSQGGILSAPPSSARAPPLLSPQSADVLRRIAVPLNVGICVVLALLEVFRGREWSEGMAVGGGYLPGLVGAVVLFARRELRVVDLGELEGLMAKAGQRSGKEG